MALASEIAKWEMRPPGMETTELDNNRLKRLILNRRKSF